MQGVPDFIVERQLGHFEKVHPDYAAGVRGTQAACLNQQPQREWHRARRAR